MLKNSARFRATRGVKLMTEEGRLYRLKEKRRLRLGALRMHACTPWPRGLPNIWSKVRKTLNERIFNNSELVM